MAGTLEVKEAFCRHVAAWYSTIIPDTDALVEYAARGLSRSIAIAPGRMVDAADDMLKSWRQNDNAVPSAPGSSAYLPIVILAVAKDRQLSGGDFTRGLAEPVFFTAPQDPLKRVFTVQTVAEDVRAQIAIFAAEVESAGSLSQQLMMYLTAFARRRFLASYTFAGMTHEFPVNIETTDLAAVSMQNDQKNLTTLVIDVGLRATIPYFRAPTGTEPTDGLGAGTVADPHGYPTVQHVRIHNGDTNLSVLIDEATPDPTVTRFTGPLTP